MYKNYNMDQTCLPIELYSCLDPKHIVFTINDFIESLSESYFDIFYCEDGRPSYHPRALIKAILFAYSRGIFSGRKIEELMIENLPMQWLTGQQIISYRTINRFRSSEGCQHLIENIFIEFTLKLKNEDIISLNHLYVDGTKIEANANKYTFVWKKATDKFEDNLKKSIKDYYLKEIQPMVDISISEEELEAPDEKLLNQFSEILNNEIQQLTQEIEDNPVKGPDKRKQRRRGIGKRLRKIVKDFLPRKQKYDAYQKTSMAGIVFPKQILMQLL